MRLRPCPVSCSRGAPRARRPRRARRLRGRRSTFRGSEGPAPAVAVLERALDEEPGKRQPSAGSVRGRARVSAVEGRRAGSRCRRPGDDAGGHARADGRQTAHRLGRGRRGGARAARWRWGCWRSACWPSAASRSAAAGGRSGFRGQRRAVRRVPVEGVPVEGSRRGAGSRCAGARGRLGRKPRGLDAAGLNDLGFSLINEGRYDEAIPVLERAVDSYEPGSTDLTYAYALFNLGQALRLAGRPEEAIPVLEQRLGSPTRPARSGGSWRRRSPRQVGTSATRGTRVDPLTERRRGTTRTRSGIPDQPFPQRAAAPSGEARRLVFS